MSESLPWRRILKPDSASERGFVSCQRPTQRPSAISSLQMAVHINRARAIWPPPTTAGVESERNFGRALCLCVCVCGCNFGPKQQGRSSRSVRPPGRQSLMPRSVVVWLAERRFGGGRGKLRDGRDQKSHDQAVGKHTSTLTSTYRKRLFLYEIRTSSMLFQYDTFR